MKVYYDFHIHSCLSPCSDEDMTPNNIVNMSLLKGLNVIALTDHNTMKNCPSVMKIAEGTGLLVIPGMEIQTREDVHVVALFKDIESAALMESILDEHRLMLPHRPDKFGQQIIMNDKDEAIEEYSITLMASIDLGIDQIIKTVVEMGGAVFPAHINKQANSVLANLGFIPKDWTISAVEVFRPDENIELVNQYKESFKILRNSDAHYLQDISEAENTLDIPSLSCEEIIKYLRGH